jgi:hypothetical protein
MYVWHPVPFGAGDGGESPSEADLLQEAARLAAAAWLPNLRRMQEELDGTPHRPARDQLERISRRPTTFREADEYLGMSKGLRFVEGVNRPWVVQAAYARSHPWLGVDARADSWERRLSLSLRTRMCGGFVRLVREVVAEQRREVEGRFRSEVGEAVAARVLWHVEPTRHPLPQEYVGRPGTSGHRHGSAEDTFLRGGLTAPPLRPPSRSAGRRGPG